MAQQGKEDSRPQLTDKEIERELYKEIGLYSTESIRAEADKLACDAARIKDALVRGGIHGGSSIKWVMSILDNQDRIDAFIEGVPKGNRYHENIFAVREFVICLRHWTTQKLFFEEDPIRVAPQILEERYTENLCLVEKAPSLFPVPAP